MYFSVKVPMKIGGKAFHTCICYALTENLKYTVEKLAEQGKAVLYNEPRYFCNGKLVAKKEPAVKKVDKKKEKKQVKKEIKEEVAEVEVGSLVEDVTDERTEDNF